MRKGVTEARLFTPPLRELTPKTSLGFACIEYAKKVLKKNLYPWQEWALIHSLETTGKLDGEWNFRFRTVVFLLSRQNGKTLISEVIASFFLNVLHIESMFGTSLSLEKAEEVWEAVIKDQEESPILSKKIKYVARRNGGKKLVLATGAYKVGAPTRRSGRGDANDVVLLDEIRELRDFEVWAASAASINAKPKGIIFCFSNAGDPDSVLLRQLRSTALSSIEGKKAVDFGGGIEDDGTLGLFEWSAPEGAATNDMDALAQANPALGYGYLTERALLSNRQTFPESKFRSECMCQQVETILPNPFPDGAWEAGIDPSSEIAADSDIYFGIDLSANRTWCSIAACGLREDGSWHIEVVARRVGSEWALDWFRTRAARGKIRLAFQGRGAPVTGLAEEICTFPNVERFAVEGGDLTAGWGRFWDAIASMKPDKEDKAKGVSIYHLPQPVLDTPAKTMQLRQIGNGLEIPDRVKSPDDISPLFACIMAFSAATTKPKEEKKIYESAYAKGAGLVFV